MKAWFRCAQAQSKLGCFSEALKDACKAAVLENDIVNKDIERLKQNILSDACACLEDGARDMSQNVMVEARLQGNQSMSQDEPEDAVKQYSAGVWIAQGCQYAPKALMAVLYANRAFANIRLQRWADCTSDCSSALTLDPTNQKVKYKRALAMSIWDTLNLLVKILCCSSSPALQMYAMQTR